MTAVTAFLDAHKASEVSRTLAESFDAYEATGTHWSPDYRKSVQHCRDACLALMNCKLSDITSGDLSECLSDVAPSTFDARVRRLRSVWNEAMRQGWAAKNLANRLNFKVRGKKDEVQIYPVDTVKDLLQRALYVDKELVPFLAVCAFTGLRPENEAFNLLWSDVHLDDAKPQIVIRPETSKTRRRRFVDIPPNCVTWLKSAARTSGRILPMSQATLRRHRQKLCKADKDKGWKKIEWINDGLRHTFASAHLAHYESIDRTVLQLGHYGNPGVLFRHYHRTMSKDAAANYWKIGIVG